MTATTGAAQLSRMSARPLHTNLAWPPQASTAVSFSSRCEYAERGIPRFALLCSWEPSQCRLRRLTAAQARQCLHRKKLVFIGDSISRYMYSALVHFLSREVWPERYGGQKGARSVVVGREFTVGHPGPDVWCAAAPLSLSSGSAGSCTTARHCCRCTAACWFSTLAM